MRANPYIGPRAFRTGETLYGREREARELLDLLIAERIVLLYSPSGAGKTSLIQAALTPKLREERFHVLPTIRVSGETALFSKPQSTVNRYVFSALLSLEEGLPAMGRLPAAVLAGMTLADYLRERPRAEDEAESEVLILDQFEEILTVDPTDRAVKEAFFEQVGAVLRDRNRWALFAMREDYVAALDPYLRRIPTRLRTTFRLDLLGVDAARLALREPACRAGVNFPEAVARKLIDDLRRTQVQRLDGTAEEQPGPYVEPVQLQVVGYRLWERLPGDAREIEDRNLAEVGDVDTALAGYYAEQVRAVSRQSGVRERAIREWFDRHLITQAGIRGQVLQEPEQSRGLANDAIRLLEDAHLVRGEKRRGATWFELAHDRLIGPVRANNAAWLQENLSPLQRQTALWDDRDRPDGLLLQGRELVTARRWAAAHADELLPSERDFLLASETRQRRANLLRAGVVCITLLAVVVLALALSFYGQWQETRRQQGLTVKSIVQFTDQAFDRLKKQPEALAVLVDLHEQYLRILERMKDPSQTEPVKAVVLQQMGDVEFARGNLAQKTNRRLARKSFAAARDHYQEALEIGRRLAHRSGDARDRLNLAKFLERMGDVDDAKNPDAALMRYEESRATARAVERSAETEIARLAKGHLSVVCAKVADLRHTRNEGKKAWKACEESLSYVRELASETSGDHEEQSDLHGACEKLAEIYSRMGRQALDPRSPKKDQARDCFQRLLEVCQLWAGDRRGPKERQLLASAYTWLSLTQLLRGYPKEAIAAAIAGRRQEPQDPLFSIYLAHGTLFSHQYDRAMTLYRSLERKYRHQRIQGQTYAEILRRHCALFRIFELDEPEIRMVEKLLEGGAR